MFSLGFLLPVSLIIFSSLTVYTSVHNVTAWSEWGTLSGPDQLWSSSLIDWDHNVATPATLYHRDRAKGTQSLLLSVESPTHNRFLSPPIWITGLEFFTLNKMPSLSFHPWFPGSLLHTVGSSPEESSKEAEESSLHGELQYSLLSPIILPSSPGLITYLCLHVLLASLRCLFSVGNIWALTGLLWS